MAKFTSVLKAGTDYGSLVPYFGTSDSCILYLLWKERIYPIYETA